MLRTLTGRLTAWLVLAAALLLGGSVIAGAGEVRTADGPAATLPAGAESAEAAALQRRLPSGQDNPALVLYNRDGRARNCTGTTTGARPCAAPCAGPDRRSPPAPPRSC